MCDGARSRSLSGASAAGQRSAVDSQITGSRRRFSTWISHASASPAKARRGRTRRVYRIEASDPRFSNPAAP